MRENLLLDSPPMRTRQQNIDLPLRGSVLRRARLHLRR
jgi:hypothetical protein